MHVMCVYSGIGLPTMKELRGGCRWHLGSAKQRDVSSTPEHGDDDDDIAMGVRGAVEGLAIK